MQKIKRLLSWAGLTVSAAVCIVAGFGGIWQQDAEAALLPNPSEIVVDTAVPEPEPEPEKPKPYTEPEVDMLARLIYTEARGVKSTTEQAAVVWVVLNRLDNPDRLQKTIAEVVTAPYQFAYRADAPVLPEFRELALDVLERWQAEKNGEEDVGRVLPAEYQYFEGWSGSNWFSAKWKSQEYWGWELVSPYED